MKNDLVQRLRDGADRVARCCILGSRAVSAPLISLPRQPSDIDSIMSEAADEIERLLTFAPMETAPKDGTVVVVIGRYVTATAGFPRHAHFHDGRWIETSRHGDPLVVWGWHPRDDAWPPEPGVV